MVSSFVGSSLPLSVAAGFRPTSPATMPSSLPTGSQMSGEHTQQPFAIVTQNLLNLGSFPIDRLAESPKADLEGFDLPSLPPHLDLSPAASSLPPPDISSAVQKDQADALSVMQHTAHLMRHVAQLHQTCRETFGNSDSLNFEFLEEHGPNSKQCVLTITRPNGLSRSYTTKPEFSRKNDAKIRAATLAIEMGAIDFILYGKKDASSKIQKQLILAPLDGQYGGKIEQDIKDQSLAESEEENDELSKQIEDCWVQWGRGDIKPRWICLNEPKGGSKLGCALCITLSLHSQRVYSVHTSFEKRGEAKRECAREALEQRVLDYIKYGNGQTAPSSTEQIESIDRALSTEPAGRTKATTLQAFFDSLPKPLPEPLIDKPVAEMNLPGWLNNMMQLAKGAKLSTQFHWFTDAKIGLHGCLLRLERPGESRSYMVESIFSKRADAKAAVCLQAMSQGIGKYIRAIATAVENKISPEMRKRVNEHIMPTLTSEFMKLGKGVHPAFEYDFDRGAFGCTLTLELSPDPKPEEIRKWTVPTEFRTKIDAKIAVVCLAADEGAIEFVRFRGQPPPPGYDPSKPFRRMEDGEIALKKEKKLYIKDEADTDAQSLGTLNTLTLPGKRRASTSGQVKLGVPLLETKEEGLAREKADAAHNLKNRNQNAKPGFHNKTPWSNSPVVTPMPYSSPSAFPGPSSSSIYEAHAQPYDVDAAATAVIERLTGSGSAHPPGYYSFPAPYDPRSVPYAYPHPPPPLPVPPLPYGHDHLSRLHPIAGPFPGSLPPPPLHPPPHANFGYPGPSPHHQPGRNVHEIRNNRPAHGAHPSTVGGRGVGRPPSHKAAVSAKPHPTEKNLANKRVPAPAEPPPQGAQVKRARSSDEEGEVPNAKRPRAESAVPATKATEKQVPLKAEVTSSPAIKPAAASAVKSYVTTLLDYCVQKGIQRPNFSHESTTNDRGEPAHKVWVVLGKERLELPTSFSSLDQGRERVAKQVLLRLRSQSKKQKQG